MVEIREYWTYLHVRSLRDYAIGGESFQMHDISKIEGFVVRETYGQFLRMTLRLI